MTISLEWERLTNLDQLATGALVQLGVLRTGALDQYDDDGDGDGDVDGNDDDDGRRRTPPLERPWRVQRWSNHSQSGVQCQPLFSLDIVAIILRIIVITVVIKFIIIIDSHHYHQQQNCHIYLHHHQHQLQDIPKKVTLRMLLKPKNPNPN